MPTQPLHPRPQLVRAGWNDLCGVWQFAFDDADEGVAEGWFADAAAFDRTITVPFPPESKMSGVHDQRLRAVVWYRLEVPRPDLGLGERLMLHFGAVDYAATVWVNGRQVGGHEGGHTPFSFDVTDTLTADEMVVVVRARDEPGDTTQPRGKQDWLTEPHGIWYHRTTGIWQPVWTERVPACHVTDLHWTPDVAGARVGVEARFSRLPEAPCQVRLSLSLSGEPLAEQTMPLTTTDGRWDVAVPALRHGQHLDWLLWSPESPTLVDAEVTVLAADDSVVDHVTSYLGIRTTGVGDGRFLLNGAPYFLRLVLEQGYWPESHLAAPSPDALRREAELVKELGFNGVRIHQKVEDPRFLYWCDRFGLLVWDEMPSAYEFAPRAVERVVAEWMEVVRRDRSHPSVVTWVPLNESWGVPHIEQEAAQQHYATALYHLTHALDPTRPVISNDGWEHTTSDIWGVHDYAAFGDSLRERYRGAEAVQRVLRDRRPGPRRVVLGEPQDTGQPLVLTEFGGLSYSPSSGQSWFGYATVESDVEYGERLEDLIGAILDNPELAGFCYTQLTDTEQERNGLLAEDRTPKLPLNQLRALLSRPARAIPPEEIDANRRVAPAATTGRSAEPTTHDPEATT